MFVLVLCWTGKGMNMALYTVIYPWIQFWPGQDKYVLSHMYEKIWYFALTLKTIKYPYEILGGLTNL